MPKLTNEQKAKNVDTWIKALRSGKYKQGKGQLAFEHQNGNKKYCCLGLACEVLGLKYNRTAPLLSSTQKNHLGLRYRSGSYGTNDLVHMNDDSRKSFKQIANIIVRRKSELFTRGVAELITAKIDPKVRR